MKQTKPKADPATKFGLVIAVAMVIAMVFLIPGAHAEPPEPASDDPCMLVTNNSAKAECLQVELMMEELRRSRLATQRAELELREDFRRIEGTGLLTDADRRHIIDKYIEDPELLAVLMGANELDTIDTILEQRE